MNTSNPTENTETKGATQALDPTAMFCNLQWMKGPANGGGGTAGKTDDGHPLWWDGDLIVVIIEIDDERRDIRTAHVNADEDRLSFEDSFGDCIGWDQDSISWFAKIEDKQLPPVLNRT